MEPLRGLDKTLIAQVSVPGGRELAQFLRECYALRIIRDLLIKGRVGHLEHVRVHHGPVLRALDLEEVHARGQIDLAPRALA